MDKVLLNKNSTELLSVAIRFVAVEDVKGVGETVVVELNSSEAWHSSLFVGTNNRKQMLKTKTATNKRQIGSLRRSNFIKDSSCKINSVSAKLLSVTPGLLTGFKRP